MTIRNLDRLLAPRSVALIGASDHPGTVGATNITQQMRQILPEIMPLSVSNNLTTDTRVSALG
jgi:hypothetical protein